MSNFTTLYLKLYRLPCKRSLPFMSNLLPFISNFTAFHVNEHRLSCQNHYLKLYRLPCKRSLPFMSNFTTLYLKLYCLPCKRSLSFISNFTEFSCRTSLLSTLIDFARISYFFSTQYSFLFDIRCEPICIINNLMLNISLCMSNFSCYFQKITSMNFSHFFLKHEMNF